MSQYSIQILKPAEIEFDEAFEWYNEQLVGLGRKFFGVVSIFHTSRNPKKFEQGSS